jgi:hypothetical protein
MSDIDTRRTEFLDGAINELPLGRYGGTVRLTAKDGAVQLYVSQPKRKQVTHRPDTPALRKSMLEAADRLLADLQAPPPPPLTVKSTLDPDILTPREIYISYLRSKIGDVPDDVLTWGRRRLKLHYQGMNTQERKAAPSFDYSFSVLVAARSLDAAAAVPLDSEFDRIEPADLNDYARRVLAKGSPHTAKTYLRRFRTAVQHFRKSRPRRWGARIDPTTGTDPVKTSHIQTEEIGEERTVALLIALRELGHWRAWGTASIAAASARRVGAIAGAREGLHLDAPPLCASDFRIDAKTDQVIVCWRANCQKGHNYSRGDVEQAATHQLAETYRWISKTHPNPLGPEHPLIWDAADPRCAASYDTLRRALKEAWVHAFDEERPKGVAWHAFCSTTISTVMDALGGVAAAEFSGRSLETVTRTYKRIRSEQVAKTAAALDELRGEPTGWAESLDTAA